MTDRPVQFDAAKMLHDPDAEPPTRSDFVAITRAQAFRLKLLLDWVHGSGRHPEPRFTGDELLELMRALSGGDMRRVRGDS